MGLTFGIFKQTKIVEFESKKNYLKIRLTTAKTDVLSESCLAVFRSPSIRRDDCTSFITIVNIVKSPWCSELEMSPLLGLPSPCILRNANIGMKTNVRLTDITIQKHILCFLTFLSTWNNCII